VSNRKYILLIERGDVGLQNFAPDADLLSFEDARTFVQKRQKVRLESGLPAETFHLAEVCPTPLIGAAIDMLWEQGAEHQLIPPRNGSLGE